MQDRISVGYATASEELIPRFEAISSDALYAHVAHLIPQSGAQVLDIGAGTGRDAAWLAAKGNQVLAVEPVAAFRDAGQGLHPSCDITWVDDRLPDLHAVAAQGKTFDFILLNGVWQHLTDGQRQIAMQNIRALTAPSGRVMISIRNGPGAPSRPTFKGRVEDTAALAEAQGFSCLFKQSTPSIQPENQAAGVTWDWVVLQAPQANQR
ncbi:MAG: methyltransferase domain-containing protein [Albidovulum sp.]